MTILTVCIPCKYSGCGQRGGGGRRLYPGVVQHLHSCQPLSGVPHQELADQVAGVVRDVLPLVVGELKHSVLDPGEERLLAVLARLSPLPATLLPTLAVKRGITTQHDVPVKQTNIEIYAQYDFLEKFQILFSNVFLLYRFL